MTHKLPVQIALLTFGLAVVIGLAVQNTPTTILSRALACMLVALLAGQFAAWVSKLVLRDHLAQAKRRIDEEHVRKSRDAAAEDPPSVAEVGKAG